MSKLFLVLVAGFIAELYLLSLGVELVGFLPVLAALLFSASVGGMLAQREGLRVLGQWQQTVARGQMPEEGLLGAVLVFVGGALLVLPGFLSDVAGVLLLIPPTRRAIAGVVRKRLERSMRKGSVRVTTIGGMGGPFGGAGPFGGPGPFGPGPRDVTPRDAAPQRPVSGPEVPGETRARRISDDGAEVEDAELVDDQGTGGSDRSDGK